MYYTLVNGVPTPAGDTTPLVERHDIGETVSPSEIAPGFLLVRTPEWRNGDFGALVGHRYQVDCSIGVITCTLPEIALLGDEISIEDASLSWATHNLILSRNGLKINGGTEEYICDVVGDKISLTYISDDYGWSIK